MTARERALAACGGKCAWCGSTDNLEFDHINNDGAAHRKALGSTKIETWVLRFYAEHQRAPTSTLQLLCKVHHDSKSGRRPAMPPRKGATQHNVILDDVLGQQLVALAEQPEYHGQKSEVVAAALRLLLGDGAQAALLTTLHQHFDVQVVGLKGVDAALAALQTAIKSLEHRLYQLDDRLSRQEGKYQEFVGAVNRLYDYGTGRVEGRPSRWASAWRTFLGTFQ
jgi:hypothetical protein